MTTASRTLYVAREGKLVPWEVPLRELGPKDVRIKVRSVGINPIDWKTIDNNLADGCGQGCDFAGIVTEVGANVSAFKEGDTVAGGVAGGNVDDREMGSFTNVLTVDERYLFTFPHTLSKSEHAWHISAGIPITFEQAASLGIACDTTAISLGKHVPKAGEWALIYGVTSSTGYIAAQYARNLGYSVIGVSAPDPDLLNILSIEHLDRNDPDWPKLAKDLSKDNITFALDAITIKDSLEQVFSTLTTKSPVTLATLDPSASLPESLLKSKANVTLFHTLYFQMLQEVKKFGTQAVPKNKEVYDNSDFYISNINKMLNRNEIRSLPITVVHGLDKIEEALDFSRKGVRACKIVVNVEK